MSKSNPYTLVFGKEPGELISRVTQFDDVIENFTAEKSSQQVYMVTGVRGSGKTVFMTEVANHLRSDEQWVVTELNPPYRRLKVVKTAIPFDDIYTIMLCNLKANFCFAHSRRTSYYDKRIHKQKCFVLTLTDNATLRLFEELNNILYLLGHRQFGLNFLYTLFNESMREYDTICLTDIVD